MDNYRCLRIDLLKIRSFTILQLRNSKLSGIIILCLFNLAIALSTPRLCLGQASAKAWGQEATFDGYNIEVRYNEDRGRNGLIHAPVNILEVNGAKVCADCNGGPYIEFNCNNGDLCVTGSVKDTGLMIVGEGEKSNQNTDVNASSF